MGTWGVGSFENDAASDWALELEDSDDLSVIESTFEKSSVAYLEGSDGEEIIAAAETILALSGSSSASVPAEIQSWVSNHRHLPSGALKPAALSALDRLLGEDSELLELWSEADEEYPRWRANLKRLRESLASAEFPPPPLEPPEAQRESTKPQQEQKPEAKPWWKIWD